MNVIKNLRSEISQKNIYQNIVFFSLVLAPIAFAAGPAVMEILVMVSNLSFLFLVVTKKISNYPSRKIFFYLLLYLAIILITSLFSIIPIVSLKSGVLSFRFIVFVFASIYILNVFKSGYVILFYTYIFIFSFILADAYIQFFLGKDLFFIEPLSRDRITGVFGDEKKLGSFLVRLIPILIGLSLILLKNKNYLISTLILLFSFPIIIFTQERIASLFLVIIFVFFAIYSWNRMLQNKKSYTLLFCLFVSIPLIFYNLDINKFKERITDTKIQLNGGEINGKLVFWSTQHQSFAKTSIEIFKKNKLFGSGIKTYREACKEIKIEYKNNCSTHPHNVFFQILSETGFLGIIFYLTILFFLMKKQFLFFFSNNKKDPNIFFLLGFFFYINPFFPSGQLFNNWYMGIGIFSLIFYFYFEINKQLDQTEHLQ